MNVIVGPFYKSSAFWMTVVSAVAAVLGGIFSNAEVELFSGAAALVIAYLIARGVVVSNVARARGDAKMTASRDEKPTEINF